MMNPFIKEQLDNLSIPVEEVSSTEFLIKKVNETYLIDLEPKHFYIIEVEDYIIHPYKGFTLHENWNKGIVPTDKKMKCEVVKVMGKMIYIEAQGMNDGKMWEGWLPKKSVKRFQVVA